MSKNKDYNFDTKKSEIMLIDNNSVLFNKTNGIEYKLGYRIRAIKNEILYKLGNEFCITKFCTDFNGHKGLIAVEVTNLENQIHSLCLTADEIVTNFVPENTFEHYNNEPKIYQKRTSVTEQDIDEILKKSNVDIRTVFDKCTVVSVQLPNGFVIVEYSACVSPENYNRDLGVEICMSRIKNKLWELEGYVLQCKNAE